MFFKKYLYYGKITVCANLSAKKDKNMEWIKIGIIVAANAVLLAVVMIWSGKEGKAFRKSIRRTP
jgi:hypothetical protein